MGLSRFRRAIRISFLPFFPFARMPFHGKTVQRGSSDLAMLFTLIELLVVIAIIAVWLSPCSGPRRAGGTRRAARRSQCVSNAPSFRHLDSQLPLLQNDSFPLGVASLYNYGGGRPHHLEQLVGSAARHDAQLPGAGGRSITPSLPFLGALVSTPRSAMNSTPLRAYKTPDHLFPLPPGPHRRPGERHCYYFSVGPPPTPARRCAAAGRAPAVSPYQIQTSVCSRSAVA